MAGEPEYVFADSRIRNYEAKLRKDDPANAGEIINQHKINAFITVGSMLTAGSGIAIKAIGYAWLFFQTQRVLGTLNQKAVTPEQKAKNVENLKGAGADIFIGLGTGIVAWKGLSSLIKSAPSLVKTSVNEAFFWSGRTEGVGGADVALEIARSRGGITLEGLIESKGIKMPSWDMNNPASVKAWTDISVEYASQVSGRVGAVIGKEIRKGAVWLDELKTLRANKNVTEIYTIDPKTHKETTIFKR